MSPELTDDLRRVEPTNLNQELSHESIHARGAAVVLLVFRDGATRQWAVIRISWRRFVA